PVAGRILERYAACRRAHVESDRGARDLSFHQNGCARGDGPGLGGFATILPDMGILSAITVRMLQKLSLIYGFEYTSADEETELWLPAATPPRVGLLRAFFQKQTRPRKTPPTPTP